MIAYGNWMVRYATVYRKYLVEVFGYSKERLESFDFNDLQKEVKSHGGVKAESFKPYRDMLNGAW